jgi:xanthine/CO dehydrogenase XdhC/CoxF family maturation factor
MKLTTSERRRIWLAQQRARETTLTRLASPAGHAVSDAPTPAATARLIKAAMIALLLGCGLLATQALEFNPPASLVEALLPRL